MRELEEKLGGESVSHGLSGYLGSFERWVANWQAESVRLGERENVRVAKCRTLCLSHALTFSRSFRLCGGFGAPTGFEFVRAAEARVAASRSISARVRFS